MFDTTLAAKITDIQDGTKTVPEVIDSLSNQERQLIANTYPILLDPEGLADLLYGPSMCGGKCWIK